MSGNANIEFKSKIFVSGTIITLTGMHIGGNSTEMGIGGADSIVVRDPLTNYPYIPGSSLRGKMRSLFERIRGEMTIAVEQDGNTRTAHRVADLSEMLAKGGKIKSAGPSSDPGAEASRLFGIAIDKQKGERPEDIIPQRLVVRDAKLRNPDTLKKAKNTDMPLTEVKTEVAIDRITSKANPRQIERVPAGAEFEFEFILNLYGNDSEEEFVNNLFECMELLQDDYLGGHGSRGYGRVKFHVETLTQKTAEDYRNNNPGKNLNFPVPTSLQNKSEQQENTLNA
ncbi:MAG: type III-A CRISPR-associated RAMP protein Csm3 [Deltaproteobacteria bacterium]|nr:type III-A CRISPR-associated RAMP protein Csm3 [Deltaproteobacteria bacterium]